MDTRTHVSRPLALVALAGLGEAGQQFARALLDQGIGVRVFHRCPGARTREAAADLGLPVDCDAATAFADADLVLSVVPGTVALDVARVAATALRPDSLFADLTSASPAAVRESAALFAPGAYVDGAIMGAVSIHGHHTPLIAAGPAAARLKALLSPFGFQIDSLQDSSIGDATSLKLLRSVFTKGMDAVVMECLLAAEAAGLRDALLRQMADLDRSTTGELIEMFVRTHVPTALRRLHEVDAVAGQLHALALQPVIIPAVRARYARTVALMGPDARNPPIPAGGDVFDAVLPWLLAAERADTDNHGGTDA